MIFWFFHHTNYYIAYLEENQTLYRLKEMEYIEKIVEKIGNIEISGNGNVLEELSKIFSKK